MLIRPIEPTGQTPRPPHQGHGAPAAERADAAPAEETRALVPVSPPAPRRDIGAGLKSSRPSAAFVTHLIATEHGDPQTRTRRMASLDESALRYAEALMRPANTKVRSNLQVSI